MCKVFFSLVTLMFLHMNLLWPISRLIILTLKKTILNSNRKYSARNIPTKCELSPAKWSRTIYERVITEVYMKCFISFT